MCFAWTVCNGFGPIWRFGTDKCCEHPQWREHPHWLGRGEEVGLDSVLLEALCHAVEADLLRYKGSFPGPLPAPTVVVLMPLGQSVIPLACLMEKMFGSGAVRVSLDSKVRDETYPFVHIVKHRRTCMAQDQY